MSNEYRHIADPGLGSVSAVVSSLPAGYTLGEHRFTRGIKYRLLYNSGNSQISIGRACTPIGSAGPFSVTVSTASRVWDNLGAAFVHNTTATTGTYFWGAIRGRIQGVIGDANSVATGNVFYLAADGAVEPYPANSATTGMIPVGINVGGAASKTVTTGTLSGDPYIELS